MVEGFGYRVVSNSCVCVRQGALVLVDRVFCGVCACGAHRMFAFWQSREGLRGWWVLGLCLVGAFVPAVWFAIVFWLKQFFVAVR